MEQALLISPFLILLTGLVFHAAAHQNASPVVITPCCYVPLIYILLIPLRILQTNNTENKNRFRLLLKTPRCEIPDFPSYKFSNTLKQTSSTYIASILHPKRTSAIYKVLMNENANLYTIQRSDEFRDKLKPKVI